MKDNNTKNRDSEAAKELRPSGVNAQANAKTNRSKQSDNKPTKRKKWSLLRYWKNANRKKQIKWLAEGIVILTGIGVFGIYVWDHIQRERQFSAEHRPRIIFSRPPEFGPDSLFTCEVRGKQIRMQV